MREKIKVLFRYLPLKRGILLAVLLYMSLLIVPYVSHKKVPSSYKDSFSAKSFYSDKAGTERVAYINDNNDALLWRLHMIEQAKEEVILSTFDFNATSAGQDVMAALLQAAERGVSVKVIVDGFSGLMDVQGNEYFDALASCPNISIKIYNPINFLRPWDMQARLHDKYLMIDKKMYLLGGRNTMDLFLGDYSESKNIDRELFVLQTDEKEEHSSLNQLRAYFERVWALSDSRAYRCKRITKKVEEARKNLKDRYSYLKETYHKAYTGWDLEALTMETNKISLLTNPIETENKTPLLWYSIQQLMMEADQVTIFTPYIICGTEMYQGLEELKKKGIPVEMLTNDVASGGNPWGCTDYLNQKKKIWSTGAKVYEYKGDYSCHTKAVLIDERMSMVGSYNFDMRSTYQDTELMLAVDCKELNQIIREEAERNKTFSKIMGADGMYTYGEHYVPERIGFGKQIFYAVLRVVVIPLRRFL